MPQQLRLYLINGNSPALIYIYLIEEEPHLLFCYLRTDIIQKFVEVMETKL